MQRKLVSCGPNLKARYTREAMSGPVLLPVDMTTLSFLLQTLSSRVLHIDPKHFTFRSKGYTSSILEAAYDRYTAFAIVYRLLLLCMSCNHRSAGLTLHTCLVQVLRPNV